MSKADKFAETSKKRFEIAEVKDVKLGIGGNFQAEQVGPMGTGSAPED